MIIGVPKELDNKKIAAEVEAFSKKYRLTQQEREELLFIMNTFCKYYNKMSESSQMLEQDAIIDSFDGVLETITGTYNGTGTQTRANIFWKQIPSVLKMLKNNTSSTKNKKDDGNNTPSKNTHTSSHTSHASYTTPSYGGCGQSSSYSNSYSYGGCGGGGGYSYGHC